MLSKIFKQFSNQQKIKNIEYIVWDFDGTLYDATKIIQPLKKCYYHYLLNKGFSISEQKFDELISTHKTWAGVVSHFTKISTEKIIDEVDSSFNKIDYISPNPKIVSLIKSLSNYKHIILSNASISDIESGLKKIGFPSQGNQFPHFEKIFSKENTPLKPAPEAFEAVALFTSATKANHLMIGDMEEIDLLPAEKFGFQSLHIKEVFPFFSHF